MKRGCVSFSRWRCMEPEQGSKKNQGERIVMFCDTGEECLEFHGWAEEDEGMMKRIEPEWLLP